MSRCLGCFESIDGVTGPCPYCGYSKDAPAQNKIFLSHGSMLADRYKIGNITKHDNENTTYLAWDNVLECKVNVTEYLPVQHVQRNPENNELTAINDSSSAVFDKGFIQFVNKAKQLYKEGGSVMVYDCIAENNTAYMIVEYKPEKKPYVGVFKPQQPVITDPVVKKVIPPKPGKPLQPQSEKRKPEPLTKPAQPEPLTKPAQPAAPEAKEPSSMKVKPPKPQAKRIASTPEPEKLDPSLQSPAYQIYQMQTKAPEPAPAPAPIENSPFKQPAQAQSQAQSQAQPPAHPNVPVQTMPPSPRPEPAVPVQRPVANSQPATVKRPEAPRSSVSAPAKQNSTPEGLGPKIARLPIWLKVAAPAVLVVGIVLIILAASGVFKKPAKPVETEPSETTEETEPEIIEVVFDEKTSFSFRGHTYAYFKDAESWEEAEKFCEARGGHLVVITTKEENDAVWAFAQTLENKSAFIGLSDVNTEGKWQWITGEPFSFSNWIDGEPNAYTEEENYAEFSFNYKGGYWNDFRFDKHEGADSVGFICEWDSDMINPVAGTALTADEAVTAFRYHIADSLISYDNYRRDKAAAAVTTEDEDEGEDEDEDYVEDDYAEPIIANWKQLDDANGISSFFYQMENGECFVFYTDLSTGITTSLKYSDPSLSIVLTIGQSDYNAFECLDLIKELPDNSAATDLKDYLNKNIRESVTAIGSLEDVSPEGNLEFQNDDMFISTSRDYGTEDIRYIQLRGSSGKYSLYGAATGIYWNYVVTRITLAGAQTATRIDDKTYVFTFEDGTTVTLTNNADRIVTHITAKIESPDQ